MLTNHVRSMDPIGLVSNGQLNGMPPDQPYSTKLISLEKEISTTYPPLQRLPEQTTVFLTGATGFLGAYILKDLLARPKTRVIAHVRAANEAEGLERIKGTCQAYGIWSDAWSARLGCVIGDLQKAKLGLGTEDWRKVDNEADIVIHNGAKVHWVLPCKSHYIFCLGWASDRCDSRVSNTHPCQLKASFSNPCFFVS